MKQKISKVMKYIGILIAVIAATFILSVLLLDIIDLFLWNLAGQYSLLDDGSRLVFIWWMTAVMTLLEIIGLIVYNRKKSISN